MDYAGDLEPAHKKGWVIWHLKTKQNKKNTIQYDLKIKYFFNIL